MFPCPSVFPYASSWPSRAVLLATAICLGIPIERSSAADFTVGVVTGEVGGHILLPIELGGADVPVAVQFDILYNAERLASEPVVKGPAALSHTVASRSIAEGRRRVILFSNPNAPIPDGVVVEVPFSSDEQGEEGTSVVNLTRIRVALADGTSAPGEPNISPGAVNLTPTLGIPVLQDLSIGANGNLTLNLQGGDGRRFEVEVSDDLENWAQLGTVEVAGGTASFVDADINDHPKRFYRVRPAP